MVIQEAIRNCDRKEVISNYLYYHVNYRDYPEDKTIKEINERITDHLNKVMDKLCKMEPVKGDRMVFLAVHTSDENNDISFNLYNTEDLKEDKELYTSYGYEFTPFEETLNFEIGDTYLTKYYLNELIADYLYEVTWTGWDQDDLENDLNKLKESEKEIEEHPEKLKTLDIDKIREEWGLEKHDPKQWKAYTKFIKQQSEYCRRCAEIEIKKWRKDQEHLAENDQEGI